MVMMMMIGGAEESERRNSHKIKRDKMFAKIKIKNKEKKWIENENEQVE